VGDMRRARGTFLGKAVKRSEYMKKRETGDYYLEGLYREKHIKAWEEEGERTRRGRANSV